MHYHDLVQGVHLTEKRLESSAYQLSGPLSSSLREVGGLGILAVRSVLLLLLRWSRIQMFS